MHIDPDRILVVAGRHLAKVESNRVERFMDAAVVAGVFQATVGEPDHTPFSANVLWRTRVAGGIIGGHRDGVADFVFANRLVHDFFQSGRTRGISAST